MRASPKQHFGFSLLELLVVVSIIALLVGIVLPSLAKARRFARAAVCLSNQRQIGIAAQHYFTDHNGHLFHHHEGWVLDDGTQVASLPPRTAAAASGGRGHSQAEKPWVIFFQPYLRNRSVGFCPSDPTPRSRQLATNLVDYNGGILRTDEQPPADSELAIAEREHLTMQSYLLNSVFTHKSARYALEGALHGFMTESKTTRISKMIMFSERNSEAMNARDNAAFGSVGQDDYDTWVGEAALVRWGPEAGLYADQGWIRYNRHSDGANYLFIDGHAERLRWKQARIDQFPDRRVRRPLVDPP